MAATQPTNQTHTYDGGYWGRELHPIRFTHTIPYQHSNCKVHYPPMRNKCYPNEFQGVKFLTGNQIPDNLPKNARKLRGINDGTRSDEGTKVPQPFKNILNNTKVNEAKIEYDFQVEASRTLKTNQFCKNTAEVEKPRMLRALTGGPSSPLSLSTRNQFPQEIRKSVLRKRRETENEEEQTKSRPAQQ